MARPDNIPTIDLEQFRSGDAAGRDAMIRTLGEGLQEFGFLNVESHGVDGDLVRRVYDHWRRFFELSEETKEKYAGVEGGARGFTPFGVEHAKGKAQADLKEFWHVGQELPAGHPLASHYPGNLWPDEVPGIREATLDLYRSLERTAREILHALAFYFDLPEATFSRMMEDGNSILRVIHYPEVPADAEAGAVRAAEHEDINLITLLPEATDSGLEILTRDGEWMAVETGPGQIVVDAGDMLSRATNEVVPATTHRVVNPEGEAAKRERYSMPFFVHPFPACDLTVMDRFVSEDRPPKYEPITAGEFLDQRLREIGLKK
jgi:isopenicillin N synthase-like dioxygenase